MAGPLCDPPPTFSRRPLLTESEDTVHPCSWELPLMKRRKRHVSCLVGHPLWRQAAVQTMATRARLVSCRGTDASGERQAPIAILPETRLPLSPHFTIRDSFLCVEQMQY